MKISQLTYQVIENDAVVFEGSLFQCFKDIADREIDHLSDPRFMITTEVKYLLTRKADPISPSTPI